MLFTSFFATLALTAPALGHTIFQELWVNGVSQGHLTGIRVPNYDGPITDVTSNDIICNGGPNPLITPYPTTVIDVPAGGSVTAEWHHTLSGANASDGDDPISSTHKGPVIAYLAKVPSALQTDVTGLGWFKIYHDGLHSDGTWAVDTLIANDGKVTFTIPSCIPSGNYFLRVEIIALHGASSYPGAQFYMECAQINVTGGGSASPSTVSFPGAYSGSDPGVLINIYYPTPTSYTIPVAQEVPPPLVVPPVRPGPQVQALQAAGHPRPRLLGHRRHLPAQQVEQLYTVNAVGKDGLDRRPVLKGRVHTRMASSSLYYPACLIPF
ncbi:hypothetical protein CPB86DRAFT_817837 [Serendipita vermifera]|nr:hypothetical protein CPB86DRAFT_817837 [Serendipita vermifera]